MPPPAVREASMVVTRAAAPHDRLPSLDGLRGIAIAMILAFHLFPQTGTSAVAKTMGSFCLALWSGVDLFFVLSGFLITGILVDHRDSPDLFRSFYGRRVLRI